MKYRNVVINSIICTMLCLLLFFTTFYSSSYVFNFNNENVVYNGNQSSNKVSLMINVYGGTEFIEPIINTFKEYNAKTTFFIGGVWLEKNLETLALMISEGHEIGNHGYLHLDQDKLDYSQNYEEIVACDKLVEVYTGYDMKLFAPPSGAYNNATIQAATDLGYTTIMWSKDTIDWRDQDSNLIYQRATKNLKGGDLILMHPTAKTVESLRAILEYCKINNLEVTTVSNNLLAE